MTNKEQVMLRQATDKIAKYEWLLNVHRKLHRPTQINAIDISELTKDLFQENYYRENRPLYIYKDDDAELTLDSLKELVGNIEVEIMSNRNSSPNYERQKSKLKHKILFHDFVDMLEVSSNDSYMVAYNENYQVFSKLPIPDIDLINNKRGFVWLGPATTVTPWHYDLTNNLLLQLMGHKRVLLIPSWDLPLTRNNEHVFGDMTYKSAIINPTPNEPEIIEVILRQGDMLFLPIAWMHQIVSLATSLTITFTDFVGVANDFSATFPGHHESPKPTSHDK